MFRFSKLVVLFAMMAVVALSLTTALVKAGEMPEYVQQTIDYYDEVLTLEMGEQATAEAFVGAGENDGTNELLMEECEDLYTLATAMTPPPLPSVLSDINALMGWANEDMGTATTRFGLAMGHDGERQVHFVDASAAVIAENWPTACVEYTAAREDASAAYVDFGVSNTRSRMAEDNLLEAYWDLIYILYGD